ncbi:MAG TPA: hypothetical protein PLU39_13940 [Armatimonadota bacterium]|nr:hypothetical protein [Armatimonadota bacterium]HOM83864.1 hypothetical protein [Armatimonadota bacterium]HPO71225.1 hypothetical protein [Armatimonadota bacterium]HPT98964.1 hypothetical protein [Armatimonadota bacterium]
MPGRLLTECPIWSPDGRALLLTTGGRRIYLLDRTEGRVRFLTYGCDPAWSPDGRQIAFVCLGRRHEVGIIRADGQGGVRILRIPSGVRPPLLWDRVGASLCFADARGRVIGVRVPDGTPMSWSLPSPVDALAASPDGEWLAFTAPCEMPGVLCLYLYHRRDRSLRVIAQVPPCRLYWTRKGRALTALAEDAAEPSLQYEMATGRVRRLHVPEGLVPLVPSPTDDAMLYLETRAPGQMMVGEAEGNRLRLFAHGYFPAWSPDGESIAFYDNPDEEASLCMQSRDGANFLRGPGGALRPPLRERALNLLSWSMMFALFPGLPSLGAAVATAHFLPSTCPWRALALLLGWIAWFTLYRPFVRWARWAGYAFESSRLEQALAAFPAALLVALSVRCALRLHLAWVGPLLAAWWFICAAGACMLSRGKPGSYRAIAAAWGIALAATLFAGIWHARQRAPAGFAASPAMEVSREGGGDAR